MFNFILQSTLKKEIEKANTAVEKATGGTVPTLLRPPGGNYNDQVKKAGKEMGFSIILWSVDTLDWKNKDEESILEAAMQEGYGGVKDGSIILMHDIYETSVSASLQMVDQLLEEGYHFVTVSELLALRYGGAEAGNVYSHG